MAENKCNQSGQVSQYKKVVSKRGKCHFRDLRFQNFPGGMPPDPPRSSRLRRSTILDTSHPPFKNPGSAPGQTDRQTEFSSKILPLYKLPDRRQTDRQTNSFRDLVFDTTSPFLFPCRCEGGTDAAQVESGTQESRSSRTGQDKIIESLWKSFLFFRKIWKNSK